MPRVGTIAGVALLGLGALGLLSWEPGTSPTMRSGSRELGVAGWQAAFDRALTARTRALEQLADRCVPELWGEAEAERDRAGEAQQEGDLERARTRYANARGLYETAGAQASAQLVRGTCTRGSEPPLVLPESGPEGDPEQTGPYDRAEPPYEDPSGPLGPYDPYDPRLPRDETPPRESAEPPRQGSPDPPVSNAEELMLRTRANQLVRAGRPCAAIELLRTEGRSKASRDLALILRDRCHTVRDTP